MKIPFSSEDKKLAMKNVPDSVDFKFFDTLVNYDKSIIIEVRELKKEISKLRKITKFKIVALTFVLTFLATLFLCVNTGVDEFVMKVIGGV